MPFLLQNEIAMGTGKVDVYTSHFYSGSPYTSLLQYCNNKIKKEKRNQIEITGWRDSNPGPLDRKTDA